MIDWGGMGWNGTADLAIISTRLNSEGYTEIIQDNLLPKASQISGRGWIFQQDNASIHNSNFSKQWFASKNVRLLSHSAKSPDLNPIENLWGILARQLYGRGKQYIYVNELKVAIFNAWRSLRIETLQNLIRSMKNRVLLTRMAIQSRIKIKVFLYGR